MAWDQTDEGRQLNDSYNALLDAYQETLPNQRQQLEALASRPITG